MASLISHIVYAKKYLEKNPLSNEDRDEFLAGCVFPDIRRIDESIKRGETHLHFQNIDLNFKDLSPFEAGWKFHLYCDMKREDILNEHNFYTLPKTMEMWSLPAKILEDKIIYADYKNWEKLTHYFNNVPFLKTNINVPRETFELWYAISARYMEKFPCEHAIRIFLSKLNFSSLKIKSIVKIISGLEKNNKAVNFLKQVKEEII